MATHALYNYPNQLLIYRLESSASGAFFARKYHADCTLCHTIYPRLNRTGYEFRRHGYRFITTRVSPSSTGLAKSGAASGTATVAEGRQLIDEMSCRGCHSVEGRGGSIGPPLDGVITRRSTEYITAQITNPKQHKPSSVMPASKLQPDQLHDIVAYLTTLHPEANVERRKDEPRVLDYIGTSWAPAIRLSQSGGVLETNYDVRELTVFAAGTFGSHLSMFVESEPSTGQSEFAQQWGEAQGVFNWAGGSGDFLVRGGQLLAWQGNGFGATDRVFSDSYPLIYNPVNGFAAAQYVRGASAEYTFGQGTTLKLFGGDTSDSSRSTGVIFEQVIGNTGLSGFSVSFVDGWNPLLRNGPTSPELRFRRLLIAGNKSFQDSRGRERINLLGAVLVGDDNHRLGANPILTNHSYGSYVEFEAIPAPRHLGLYLRADQLRSTTQQNGSTYAGSAGMTVDVTHFARLLLEYQRFDNQVSSNFYSIGFRLNY